MIDIDFNIKDFDEIANSFDFDVSSFDLNNIMENNIVKTRYIKPPITKLKAKYVKYKYAVDLAKNINLLENERIFAIIDGSFIFGDLFEALAVEKQIYIEELTISTLSLSQNNIDSFANLINNDYLGTLNIIISDYFFSHERNNLIPYMYKMLDVNNNFQLATASTHCKTALLKSGKNYITIHGSANLRSSGNIEQIMIENNKDLYQFNYDINVSILEKYKTINKSLRNDILWQAVQVEAVEAVEKQGKVKAQQVKGK